jgi:hypothetical protein
VVVGRLVRLIVGGIQGTRGHQAGETGVPAKEGPQQGEHSAEDRELYFSRRRARLVLSATRKRTLARAREKMASQPEEAPAAAEAQQAEGMEVEQEETTLESDVEKAEVAEGGGEGSAPEPEAKMEEEQEGSGPAGADAGQAEGGTGEAKEGEEESAAPRAEEDAGEAASSDALQAQASGDNGGFFSLFQRESPTSTVDVRAPSTCGPSVPCC